ncbi:unnamed protein product, partial [marine sediment metagenome]
NRRLGRKGPFWKREYYDHLVRDEDDYRRVVKYVLSNPERAGLENWQWVYGCGEDEHAIASGTLDRTAAFQAARQRRSASAGKDAGGTLTFGPEDIFHYMYAIFHSPTYRTRYAEFLKIDFPRLPLTSDQKLFAGLCGLGQRLVKLHLMEADYDSGEFPAFNVQGDNVVEKVRYREPPSPRPSP